MEASSQYLLSNAELVGLLPELMLAGGGVLVLLLDAFFPRLSRGLRLPLSLLATAAAGHFLFRWFVSGESFGGLLQGSGLTQAISLVLLVSTLLCLLSSEGYLRREKLRGGEYHALLLWCATGLLLMTRATELVTIFVALELLSICLYSLAAYHRRLALATEAGLKYFLMGAFVSAFVLLGIALLYGETGSTRLEEIGGFIASQSEVSALTVLGILLLIAGFGFKMSVAPFHAWAPDTYQGAPSPFVGFLSVAPKAASAVVLIRILSAALQQSSPAWSDLIAFLAVLSMLVGNLLALAQKDIKRMLAYSGIAHMGYLLVAFVGLDSASGPALLVYMLAYALMNAGAFAVITLLYSRAGEQHLISELGGWGYRYPVLALALTISMLSLGGIPPTLGFLGKYLIFIHAIESGHLLLAVAIVLTSLVGVFYYLRIVYTLYMKPSISPSVLQMHEMQETQTSEGPDQPDEFDRAEGGKLDLWGWTAACLAAGVTLLLGLWPGPFLEWALGTAQFLY